MNSSNSTKEPAPEIQHSVPHTSGAERSVEIGGSSGKFVGPEGLIYKERLKVKCG